jgi:hypothetical protein
VLCVTAGVLLALLAFRFVPRLNDSLSAKPEYTRILTEAFARHFAIQTQMQFPVIVEHDERGTCPPVVGQSLPEDKVRGTLYLLAYSEQRHMTCINTYVVPMDASTFPNLRIFTPTEGKNYGPTLLGATKASAESRMIHVYASEYLRRLHWRYTPHFPLSTSEAESLRSQSYYSSAKQPGDSVSIDLDYAELRAEVAAHHHWVNLVLSGLLIGCGALLLLLLRMLVLLYRSSSQQCRIYQIQLTPTTFLREDIGARLKAARREYLDRLQQAQASMREEDKLRALWNGWQEDLRSALPSLTDELLRTRVQECLEHHPQDAEQLKNLWLEVKEQSEVKTPADKLALLLESVRPYCTQEEFLAGRAEAFAMLSKSGFRTARSFAIAMHDELRARAREMSELENSGMETGPSGNEKSRKNHAIPF